MRFSNDIIQNEIEKARKNAVERRRRCRQNKKLHALETESNPKAADDKQISQEARVCKGSPITQSTVYCPEETSGPQSVNGESNHPICGALSQYPSSVYCTNEGSSLESPAGDSKRSMGYKATLLNLRERIAELANERSNTGRRNTARTAKDVLDFDPEKLPGAQRAKERKTRLLKKEEKTMEQIKKMANFKALPLPSGNIVKNNIHALTTAAEKKQTEKSSKKNQVLTATEASFIEKFMKLVKQHGKYQNFGSLYEYFRTGHYSVFDRTKITNYAWVQQKELDKLKQIRFLEDAYDRLEKLIAWKDSKLSWGALLNKNAKNRVKHEVGKLDSTVKSKRRCRFEISKLLALPEENSPAKSYSTTKPLTNTSSRKNSHPSYKIRYGELQMSLPIYERQEMWLVAKEDQLETIRASKEDDSNGSTLQFNAHISKSNWETTKALHDEALCREQQYEEKKRKADEEKMRMLEVRRKDNDLRLKEEIKMNMELDDIPKPRKIDQLRTVEKLSQPRKNQMFSKAAPIADVKQAFPADNLLNQNLKFLSKPAKKSFETQSKKIAKKEDTSASKILDKSSAQMDLSNMTDIEFTRFLHKNT